MPHPPARQESPYTSGPAARPRVVAVPLPLQILTATGIYGVAAWAGFRLFSVPGSIAILWPAAGVLVGALLLLPRAAWWSMAGAAWGTTALLQHLLGVPLTLALPLSGLGVAEAVLATWTLMRMRPALVRFDSPQDLFALVTVGTLSSMVAAAAAAMFVRGAGGSMVDAWHVFTVWSSGHAVGIMLFAPAALVWKRPHVPTSPGAQRAGRAPEAILAFGAMSLVSVLVFFDGVGIVRAPMLLSLPFEVIPFAILIAVRFGVRGAVLAMVGLSLVAVSGTGAGGAAFALTHPDLDARVVVTQWYLATIGMATLVLALAIEQGRWQEFQTRLLNEALAEANGVLVHEIGERERTALSLRMLLDATPEGIVVVDDEGLIVEVNGALEWMFGYSRNQLLGQSSDMLVAETDRRAVQAYRERYAADPQAMLTRGPGPDLTAVRSDGKTFPAQVGLSPYRLGEQLRIIATVRDVTEQRAVERRMATNLREKEVLLREVHHRVKNNMAVMSSLFYLQQRYAKDPDTVRVFRESESRVRSMAMVHEVLYRSDDLSAVDFSRYLDSLVDHLANVYRGTLPGLRIEREIAPIRLSLDQAVPCGLLLNEVLTNAFKHAFVDGAPPVLRVQALARSGEVRIEIVDNGVGVPEDLLPDRTQTLGMRLMQALTEQLEGRLATVRQERGTRTSLTFPLVVGAAAPGALPSPIPA
ncbi:histidine kinase dimerization/phosphoacceptor domain -containing protein [Luteitalea sp. TBR-22]|uniref:histidine kinase dimerization/phosphoacceptor domain -containing protein n=1 Tax=Luteitalea sp. TBR-22 TaxID=2802971 RepID=UPI001EF451E9|nr:histidine kinase dimerization/phosphoacceptor domain -containing protein [Luteitalea sp. TBR-22]